MYKHNLAHLHTSLLILLSLTIYGCIEATNPTVITDVENDSQMIDIGIADMFVAMDMSETMLLDMNNSNTPDMAELTDLQPWVETPVMPMEAVAKLATEITQAGDVNRITCLVYGDHGQVIPYDPSWGQPRYDIRPLTGWLWEDEEEGIVTAEVADTYEVKCLIPSLGFRSETKSWQVTAAAPQQVITRTDESSYIAGDNLNATCEVYDRFGNHIENITEFLTWHIDPALDELEANEDGSLTKQITQAQAYQVTCEHSESLNANVFPADFSVLPALPTQLNVYFASGQQVFNIGDVIQIRHRLTDEYDNDILGVPIELTLSPSLPSFGQGNFLAETAGLYEVTVRVNEDTREELSVTRTFRIEDGPPRITCSSPVQGAMTRLNQQTISGQVIDLSDINRFTVNGRAVTLTDQGIFSTQITPEWGLNIVELLAEDQFGKETIQHCMFFASGSYLSEYLAITNVALLHLDQDAVDDGSPRSPIDSLGDLLGEMLNSDELLDTIDQTLSNLNPIVPTECWANTFLGCAFSAGVRYDSTTVNGPNTVSLSLTNGGLSLNTTINNLSLDITASGRVTGISWAQSGTVSIDSASVEAELGVSLNGSNPQVTIVGTPTITIGNITVNLSIGISVIQSGLNAFLNFVFDAFEGIVRNQISSTLETFITDEVDTILSTALNSLDLSSLGFDLNLPRPLGNGSYNLSLDFALNRLHVNEDRMQIGIKSTVGGARLNSRSSAGIPVPSGNRLVELSPGFNRDAAGAVHIGLINSILHKLWRGNYFEVSETPEGLGQDVSLSLSLYTPPAIELVGYQRGIKLHFGPAMARITLPALLDQEIDLLVGGWANSSVSINSGNELVFAPISIDELVLSSPTLELSAEALDAINRLLVGVIQDVLDEALNTALPVFPIPEFVLPNSLSSYGIPIGTRLSVGSLFLSNDSSRLIVKGNLQ